MSEICLNDIEKFSSYLTEDNLHLCY